MEEKKEEEKTVIVLQPNNVKMGLRANPQNTKTEVKDDGEVRGQ